MCERGHGDLPRRRDLRHPDRLRRRRVRGDPDQGPGHLDAGGVVLLRIDRFVRDHLDDDLRRGRATDLDDRRARPQDDHRLHARHGWAGDPNEGHFTGPGRDRGADGPDHDNGPGSAARCADEVDGPGGQGHHGHLRRPRPDHRRVEARARDDGERVGQVRLQGRLGPQRGHDEHAEPGRFDVPELGHDLGRPAARTPDPGAGSEPGHGRAARDGQVLRLTWPAGQGEQRVADDRFAVRDSGDHARLDSVPRPVHLRRRRSADRGRVPGRRGRPVEDDHFLRR